MNTQYKGYEIEVSPGIHGWYYKITKPGTTELHISAPAPDEKIAYINAKRLINEVLRQNNTIVIT